MFFRGYKIGVWGRNVHLTFNVTLQVEVFTKTEGKTGRPFRNFETSKYNPKYGKFCTILKSS